MRLEEKQTHPATQFDYNYNRVASKRTNILMFRSNEPVRPNLCVSG